MNRSPETHPNQSATAQEPEHAYDNPTITATQFLEAVYHDPTVKLRHRIDAAARLLRILYRDPDWVAREIAKAREPDLIYQLPSIKLQ